MEIAIGIILIVAAIFLVIAVLMQHGKSHNLSGTIAGGAETFFGKTKGSTMDKKLSKLTTIVAVVFCALVLGSYLIQDTTDYSSIAGGNLTSNVTEEDEHDHEHDHEHEDEGAEENGEEAAE